jgi:antitoxin component YwqK of YwqJK toxin-antitoxin module
MATRDFSKTEDACYTIFYTPEKKKVSEGWVRNRQFDGEWKYYHYNVDQLMTLENYDHGKLVGVRKVYYKNGALAEEQAYEQGKKSGGYKKYAENGALLELSNFVDNEYDGMAEFKNPNGTITGKGLFKNGKKIGMWTILQDGKLIQVNMNKKPRKFAKKSERIKK